MTKQCIKCLTNHDSNIMYFTNTFDFEILNNCPLKLSITPIQDFVSAESYSVLQGSSISNPAVTLDSLFCPILSAELLNSDGSKYAGGVITVTVLGQVKLTGMAGLAS